MNKSVLVFFIYLASIIGVQGQFSFNHSIGISAYSYEGIPGITYSPRLNILSLKKKANLSIGTHFGILYTPYQGEMPVLDIPIVMELNFGHGSFPEVERTSGGFIGIGYGYSRIDNFPDFLEAQGILANVGYRRMVLGQASLGLRVSYLYDLKPDKSDVVSIGLFYNFMSDY